MKEQTIKQGLGALILTMAVASGPARSVVLPGLPVYDAANLAATEVNIGVNSVTAATNVIHMFQLAAIKRQLSSQRNGTVNYYTKEIDKSTTNIDSSTKNIDNSITKNTEINAAFTWIINEGGDEIIPIPRKVKEKLDEVRKGQSTADYTAHYQTVDDYAGDALGRFGDPAASESSRARKAANSALVEAIASDETEMASEVEAMKELAKMNKEVVGHGNQMQVANALSAAQINQLAKLRSMMLVAETARVAELQARADKDARAVAIGKQLRAGLADAMERTQAKPVSY